MIEAILERRSSLLRHKQAPLFEERERFLAQLHQQGPVVNRSEIWLEN